MTESPIKNSIKQFQSKLSDKANLVAVSKTQSVQLILEAYEAGQRDFGENRVQELSEKYPLLPQDIRWHMIGHLQRNKVKYIAPFVHMIHSVDSERLLLEIEKQAKKSNRVISCLLQIHIAEEEAKFGWNEEELLDFLGSENFSAIQNVHIEGLMGMATNTADLKKVDKEFAYIQDLFERMKHKSNAGKFEMKHLSIGMSNDMDIAIQHGATMVRIGTAIFG